MLWQFTQFSAAEKLASYTRDCQTETRPDYTEVLEDLCREFRRDSWVLNSTSMT